MVQGLLGNAGRILDKAIDKKTLDDEIKDKDGLTLGRRSAPRSSSVRPPRP